MTHTIENQDFLRWAARLRTRSVDHVIGDPPYLPHTQDSQRSGSSARGTIDEARALGFAALTPAHRSAWAFEIARIVRRWVVVFTDHEGWQAWHDDLVAAGLVYVRALVWIRGDLGPVAGAVGVRGRKGAPQFTGDRPAAGHETMILCHAPGERLRWNGGGKTGVYVHGIVSPDERLHPAQKPLDLMRALVRDFTDKGETILDPWAGVGTTVLAAKLEDRNAIGVEIDVAHAALAAKRCA